MKKAIKPKVETQPDTATWFSERVLLANLATGRIKLTTLRSAGLTSAWFSTLAFRKIYEIVEALEWGGVAIEVPAIGERMQALGEDTQILDGLLQSIEVKDPEPYLEMLREHHLKAGMAELCGRAIAMCNDPKLSAADIMSGVRAEIARIGIGLPEADKKGTILDRMIKGELSYQAIPSRWRELQNILGLGYVRGKMTVTSARPKVGKSTYMANEAVFGASKGGSKELLISLEMPPEELYGKMVADVTGIEFLSGIRGWLTGERKERWNQRLEWLKNLPLDIVSTARTIEDIVSVIRDSDASRVWIDYVQRIRPSMFDPPEERPRYARHASMITDLAFQTKKAICCLAQLNRGADGADGARGANVKGSAQWEEDCGAMLLLEKGRHGDGSDLNVIVEYNRLGPTGRLGFRFDKAISRMSPVGSVEAPHED